MLLVAVKRAIGDDFPEIGGAFSSRIEEIFIGLFRS
jgi:hypothetical protein